MAPLKYVVLVAFLLTAKALAEDINDVFNSFDKSIDEEFSYIANLDAPIVHENELKHHKKHSPLKLSIYDIGSQYLNNTLELAKEQVQKALNSLYHVLADELINNVQNYTNAVYDCSHKYHLDQVPQDSLDELKVCANHTVDLAKPIVHDFLEEFKRVPVVFRNVTEELRKCVVIMRSSSDRFRSKDAFYCVVRVSTAKGSEISGLAADLSKKGLEAAKKLVSLIPEAEKCFEEKADAINKDLTKLSQDVANCVNEIVNKKSQ